MTDGISTDPNLITATPAQNLPPKWYKLKSDVLKTHDPMLTLIGLLFEALNVKMEEKKLKGLSPVIQYLFEETNAPEVKLTQPVKHGMN